MNAIFSHSFAWNIYKRRIMASFEIIGGKKLKGEVIPQGAKNEALQIISAVLPDI
jgi:hypothetical protein